MSENRKQMHLVLLEDDRSSSWLLEEWTLRKVLKYSPEELIVAVVRNVAEAMQHMRKCIEGNLPPHIIFTDYDLSAAGNEGDTSTPFVAWVQREYPEIFSRLVLCCSEPEVAAAAMQAQGVKPPPRQMFKGDLKVFRALVSECLDSKNGVNSVSLPLAPSSMPD